MDDETAFQVLRWVSTPWVVRALNRPSGLSTIQTQVHGKAFRFLDLPAEIRNRIYKLASGPRHVRLAYMKPPSITRVSRQLRAEAMPVWFDISTFVAEVKLNYAGNFIDKTDPVFKRTGTLGLKMEVIRVFKAAGSKDARIRNLVVGAQQPHDALGFQKYFQALLSMTQQSSNTLPTIKTHVERRTGDFYERRARDFDHALSQPKALLERMVTEPGYKGLTLPQLKKMANCFRVEPTT